MNINRREERDTLQYNDQWSGKRAHERKPISRAHQHVYQRDRPSQEDEHFKQVRQWATAQLMPADRQECGLQDEAATDGHEVKLSGRENSGSKPDHGTDYRSDKAQRGEGEEKAIHRDSNLKISEAAWQLRERQSAIAHCRFAPFRPDLTNSRPPNTLTFHRLAIPSRHGSRPDRTCAQYGSGR